MTKQPDDATVNILEQINLVCRDFGKQFSRGKSPRIEMFLSQVPEEARETLFGNLIGIEVNYRRSKSESPTSDEYLKRFPQFKKQVRRAFFEPSMSSVDAGASTDGEDPTGTLRSPGPDPQTLAPTHELPDANHLGDYELLRELGRGGMGIVYEARHSKTNNRVALKTLLAGGDAEQVSADKLYRFRKEFRRLSEINHPNLVGMQSLEVEGNRWFFTMDLIEGEDFLSYVRPSDQFSESRLRSCLSQLARGVMELHRRGIIHRDLKPSNVLVSRAGRVTILDFGLAAELQKATDLTQTRSGTFAGTPRYAAPEQMFGERNEASDWYAFGTMLYEALTGKPPFPGKDQVAVLRQKQEMDPPNLTGQEELPADLTELADGLVRREPSERLTSGAISERLGLDQDTRVPGSTRDSHGSTDSVDPVDTELGDSEDEEIVLIGRESQLAQLEQIKRDFSTTRQPQVVWITGLSGEGKSTLAEKFLRPIRHDRKMLVLSGRCYDRESVPFKVVDSITDSLVGFLRSRPTDEVEAMLPRDVDMAGHLFPVLRRVKPIADRQSRKTAGMGERLIRNLAVGAFGDLLAAVSEATPVVVFVDDLQWGDFDSAEVLTSLLSRHDPPAILFVGSYRSDEMERSPFLQGWNAKTDDHEDAPPASVVEVHPLTESQCLDFLGSRFDCIDEQTRHNISALFSQTRGNPYFLEQLIEGHDGKTGSFTLVPLEEIISARLQRCPTDALSLLEVIAVAGKAIPLHEAAQVAGLGETGISTITHMRSEHLLRLIGSHPTQLVDTYHDKIREATIESMEAGHRKALHLRYAEVIEAGDPEEGVDDRSERLFDLAHHFLQAEDPRAFLYQLEAGERAIETYAMETALEHTRTASRLRPKDLPPDITFRLELARAKSLAGCNHALEALESYRLALELAATSSDRANCLYGMFDIHWRRSEYEQGNSRLRECLAELGERPPRTTVGKIVAAIVSMGLLHLMPAWTLFRLKGKSQADLRSLSRWYTLQAFMLSQRDIGLLLYSTVRACLISRHADDKDIKAEAFCSYGWLLGICGLHWLSNRMMANAVASVAEETAEQRSGVFNYHKAFWHYCRGELKEAAPLLRLSREQLGRIDDYRQSMPPHIFWHLCAVSGDSSRLLHYATEEEGIARRTNDQIVLAFSWYGQAEGLAKQGRYEEGLRLAADALNTLKQLRAITVPVANVQQARVMVLAGDHVGARSSAWAAIRDLPWLRFFEISAPAFVLYVESILTDSWVNSKGKGRRTIKLRAGLVAWIARRVGWLFPNLLPPAHRMTGRLAFSRGRYRRAEQRFDQAIGSAKKIGAEYEHARALIDKSMLDYPEAMDDRQIGLKLLELLGCVLPDAEVEYLGIDRETHHARAAAAREKHEAELESGFSTSNSVVVAN